MKIYIPSRGRAEKQTTYAELPKNIRKNTEIVIGRKDEKAYRALGYPLLVLPAGVTGIGKVRQYLIDNCPSNKIVMLDDDLTW